MKSRKRRQKVIGNMAECKTGFAQNSRFCFGMTGMMFSCVVVWIPEFFGIRGESLVQSQASVTSVDSVASNPMSILTGSAHDAFTPAQSRLSQFSSAQYAAHVSCRITKPVSRRSSAADATTGAIERDRSSERSVCLSYGLTRRKRHARDQLLRQLQETGQSRPLTCPNWFDFRWTFAGCCRATIPRRTRGLQRRGSVFIVSRLSIESRHHERMTLGTTCGGHRSGPRMRCRGSGPALQESRNTIG